MRRLEIPAARVLVWHPAVVLNLPTRRIALAAIIASGAALILAFAAIAVWISTTYDPPPGANRPNLADWLQAWGSMAAVLAGLGAVIATVLLLRHEIRATRLAHVQAARERAEAALDRQRVDDERRDAEKAQARTIVVSEVIYHSGGSDTLVRILARIENCGTGPILNTQVWAVDRSAVEPLEPFMLENCGVLGPGGQYPLDAAVSPPIPQFFAAGGRRRRQLVLEIRFVDMYGRRWSRLDNGQPVLLLDTDPREVG